MILSFNNDRDRLAVRFKDFHFIYDKGGIILISLKISNKNLKLSEIFEFFSVFGQ